MDILTFNACDSLLELLKYVPSLNETGILARTYIKNVIVKS